MVELGLWDQVYACALEKDGTERRSAEDGREEEKQAKRRGWGSRLRVGGDTWHGYKREIGEKKNVVGLAGGRGGAWTP